MFLAVAQRIADGLLHLRLGYAAQPGGFAGNELQDQDARAVFRLNLNRLAYLPGLQSNHDLFQRRVRLVQRRFRNVAQVAARSRGVHVFGIIHRQLCEVRAAVQPVHQHFHLSLGLGFVGCVVVLPVAELLFFPRCHQDLRNVILRLRHVELRFIRVVKIRDVLIRDCNLGHYFTVQQFLDRKLPPQLEFQILHRHGLIFQPPLKLVFCVGAFQLGELVLHFTIACLEVQLLRLFEQNLVIDQLVKHVQLLRKRFFGRRLLPLRVYPRAIVLVDFFPLDLFSVHYRPHVRRMPRFLVAARGGNEHHRRQRQPCCGALHSF